MGWGLDMETSSSSSFNVCSCVLGCCSEPYSLFNLSSPFCTVSLIGGVWPAGRWPCGSACGLREGFIWTGAGSAFTGPEAEGLAVSGGFVVEGDEECALVTSDVRINYTSLCTYYTSAVVPSVNIEQAAGAFCSRPRNSTHAFEHHASKHQSMMAK